MKKENVDEFDYVIVGAGAAGSIVAARLQKIQKYQYRIYVRSKFLIGLYESLLGSLKPSLKKVLLGSLKQNLPKIL